jgi:exonuclease VII small subunit
VKLVKDCREYLEKAKRRVTILAGDGVTEEDFPDERGV